MSNPRLIRTFCPSSMPFTRNRWNRPLTVSWPRIVSGSRNWPIRRRRPGTALPSRCRPSRTASAMPGPSSPTSTGMMNDDEIREVHKRCLQKLTEYSSEVSQNEALCNAYKRLAESDGFQTLSEAQQKAINNTLRDFHLGEWICPRRAKSGLRPCPGSWRIWKAVSGITCWMRPRTGTGTSLTKRNSQACRNRP